MELVEERKGMVFDIQRFSVHDGPGIRTIVFFKGCPLRCEWCCNPESQNFNKQLMVVKNNCIDCRRCEVACPYGAISFHPNLQIDRKKCVNCGACCKVCFSEALTMTGQEMTVAELITELKKDEIHYRKSKGGITLSGGEALAQPEFAAALLCACKKQGWHTAIESSGYASEKKLKQLLPYLDLFLMDIKHINSEKHRRHIGQPNRLILKSAQLVADYPDTELIVRVPVVPKFNDTPEEIAAIALFSKKIGVKKLHLLAYHGYGGNKYEHLGRIYKDKELEAPSSEKMAIFKELVEGIGLTCQIGG